MTWRDVLSLARRSIGRRPGRAALTVIAVALATSLLTALVTIADTAETRVLNGLAKGGPLSGIRVVAAEPEPAEAGKDEPKAGSLHPIDAAALRRIRRMPHVEDVLAVAVVRGRVSDPAARDARQRASNEHVLGVDLRASGRLPITLVAGRLPLPGADLEVAVSEGFLSRHGVPKAKVSSWLGHVLVLTTRNQRGDARRSQLVVVGVASQDVGRGELLVDRAVTDAEQRWMRSAAAAFGPVTTSPIAGLFVTADSLESVPAVRAAIADAGYSSSAPENLVASVRRYLRVVEIVLSGIGLIALGIAALGVANALFAAVRERRREIGVLKAIGSGDSDVLRMFLVEAASLGAVGGVLGATAGYLLARAVAAVVNGYLTKQGVAGVAVGVPWALLTASAIGAMFLAGVAGVLPARRAARLPAREAVDL